MALGKLMLPLKRCPTNLLNRQTWFNPPIQALAGSPWPTRRSSHIMRSRLVWARSTWRNIQTTSTSLGPREPASLMGRSCALASTSRWCAHDDRRWGSSSVWGKKRLDFMGTLWKGLLSYTVYLDVYGSWVQLTTHGLKLIVFQSRMEMPVVLGSKKLPNLKNWIDWTEIVSSKGNSPFQIYIETSTNWVNNSMAMF